MPPEIVRSPSACVPSSPELAVMSPAEMFTVPFECSESSEESMLITPPRMFSSLPAFMPFADVDSLSADDASVEEVFELSAITAV